jgi:hypothetical protein
MSAVGHEHRQLEFWTRSRKPSYVRMAAVRAITCSGWDGWLGTPPGPVPQPKRLDEPG